MSLENWETLETDVLILGSGGAGLCAALHLAAVDKPPSVTMAVKGLFGKSGCTRMVQGGYNAVLKAPDSLEAHYRDTLAGGRWINNQELAWMLVKEAPGRVLELENQVGCFFDRGPDGTVHQKPFAGQTHDRTVHKGDLTGIEIVSRLAEQVRRTETRLLEEVRAVDLLLDQQGDRVVGALLLDLRSGRFIVAQAKATLLATGGGPTMYRIAAPCHDKSCDGIAMGWRAGARLMDMEMVQFHPTGLLAGGNQISGTVLEEGMRGAGGYLLNARGERFMQHYDPRGERATRDIVSQACYQELMAGRGTEEGAVFLDISHLGVDFVESNFPGMTKRCRDVGFDLAREPVTVSPTAHFMMGGLAVDTSCQSSLEGLFVAGEDAAGVHGANRLGGNGVAESTVFGGLAGDFIAQWVKEVEPAPFLPSQAMALLRKACLPLQKNGAQSVYPLRDELRETMWRKAGVVRDEESLRTGAQAMASLRERLAECGADFGLAYNLAWQDTLNMENYLDVCDGIISSALIRQESRGAHYRSDWPAQDDNRYLCNFTLDIHQPLPQRQEVLFERLQPLG